MGQRRPECRELAGLDNDGRAAKTVDQTPLGDQIQLDIVVAVIAAHGQGRPAPARQTKDLVGNRGRAAG